MKILFIHEVSYLKKPIYEIHEFPEYLSVKGHDISFFEFDEGRRFLKSSTIVSAGKVHGRVLPKASLKLFRPFQLGIPVLDRIFVVFSSIFKLSALIRRHNFDLIVLYAVPTFGAQAIYLAKRARIPLVFRALDVTHKIRKSFFSPLIKQVERYVYRRADLLSANNPAMEKYCISLSGRKMESLVHFPPLDLQHFKQPERDLSLRESLGIDTNDKLIVYMGSFFYFSGLVDALKEFALSAPQEENLKFLLLGGGEQDKELRGLCKTLGLSESVIFTGMVPYKDLPRYLALADIAVNTLEPTLVANAAFPNKVLQYIATGLPVVSTKLDGLIAIFGNSNQIVWASSPAEVVKVAIQKLLGGSQELDAGHITSAKDLLTDFLPERATRKFEESLLRLSEDGGQV